MKIGIFGATGRVGRLLCKIIEERDDCTLEAVYFAGTFKEGFSCEIAPSPKALLEACDVIIDFSSPAGTEELLNAALELPKPLVIGTTGISAHQFTLMQSVAEKAPILYATNMSLGVALLNKLAMIASEALRDFDAEIVEMHHRNKKDAPSGTALTLAASVAKARKLDLDAVRVSGRNGDVGARTKDEIGVMSLRGGDIVGEHSVGFYGEGEYIRLEHTATSRETFAHGAIKAALWLGNQKAGMYSISDCLGLR
ncbi:MAG: dihydrodipicolinate reductase [Pseudomonadota bacterium]|jgi:4-hydroxy-tetrahydrodipicolinate reductase